MLDRAVFQFFYKKIANRAVGATVSSRSKPPVRDWEKCGKSVSEGNKNC